MGLGEILIGIFALLIGAMFAIQGGNLMRILIPVVGFFTGFSVGAAMVSGITGDGFLSTVFSWVVGFFVALLFGLLAYFFYAFAVVLAFAGFGFSIAAAILTLLNLDWNWLIIIVGTLSGLVFGLIAMASSLPMLLLIIASSFFGASMMIYGLMLVFNRASFGDFSSGVVYNQIRDNIGVYVLWLTVGVSASFAQIRILGEQMKLTQEYWNSSLNYDDLLKEQTKKKAN